MLRDEFVRQLKSAIAAAPLATEPFDHLELRDPFPLARYAEMLAHLPETRFYGELQHDDARLPDGRSARRKLELRPAHLQRLPAAQREFWLAVTAALTSREVESAYCKAFAGALGDRFGNAGDRPRLHAAPMLLRDLGGYKISVHCDSPRKAITTQYYLPADAAQRHLGTTFHTKSNGTFSKVRSLEFAPNTGYAFPVTPQSWHSVEQMQATDGERNSLMLIYYLDQGPVGETINRLKRFGQDLRARRRPV